MRLTKPLRIRLDKETHKRLVAYAQSQDLNISTVIRGLINRVIHAKKMAKQ